jgi:hypothetical protein
LATVLLNDPVAESADNGNHHHHAKGQLHHLLKPPT